MIFSLPFPGKIPVRGPEHNSYTTALDSVKLSTWKIITISSQLQHLALEATFLD